ncbi:MAG: divergent PAP2 family protein [Candidatus Omnitrophica bacterium]|nr:divergent PAP2 family protein [Candidatus Omnitrophota bacterium]
MKEIWQEVLQNEIFIATCISWIIAQTIKVSVGILRQRRFDFRWFVRPGGIPSAHASGAATLATSMGLNHGFYSALFALAAVFAIIVMFDAQNVRHAAGRQARILNKMMEDIYWQGRINENHLRELLGHTPIEVFLGMVLGISIAIIMH